MDEVQKGNDGSFEKSSLESLDLEEVMLTEVGVFGRFQQRVLAILAVATIFTSWGGNAYIFTTTNVGTRCLIPECEQSADSSQFLPSWLGAAVPGGDGGATNNCQRYAPINNTVSTNLTGTCPADLFDQNTLVECQQYVYEDTNSIVYEFDMACDEWRRTMIGSLRTVGALFGMPITGYMSDRWGRRFTLSVIIFLTAFIGTMRYFANTYNGYLISEIFEGFFGAGFGCAQILLIEVVGPKYGVITSAVLNSFFSVGQMTLALIAMSLPYWRDLILALYVPQFICIVMYWITPESFRWQKAKGRYEEFEISLKNVAKINGKKLSEKTLNTLNNISKENVMNTRKEEVQSEKEELLLLQVFQHTPILLRCIICPICWITLTLVYYGLSINSVGLAGNRYINYLLASAVEIPGFWLGILGLFLIGRKVTLVTAYWICGACQIAYIFIPADQSGALLAVFLIGKFSIAMVALALYVYTMELFPTKYRNTLFAFCSMVGRVGAIIAPLTPALGTQVFEELPFILFAGFALIAGLLLLLLPETRGAPLPDTLQQAAGLGKKKET